MDEFDKHTDPSGWGADNRSAFTWRTLFLCAAALAAALWLMSCSSSPAAPATVTPPPTPPQPTAAFLRRVEADLLVTETPAGLRLTGQFRNVGESCATQISGELKINDAKAFGATVATLPWTLDPAAVIRPDQVGEYVVCCFVPPTAAPDFFYTVQFSFTSVPC